MKKSAAIVPCYNEEATIEELYRRTKEVLARLSSPTKVICVDDGSQDKTRSLPDHTAATDPYVKVIHFSRNFGHQPAVTVGINDCDADLAIIIDADMQDPLELVPDPLEVQERENANVVYCIRKSREGESLLKLFTSKTLHRVMNYMSRVHFSLDAGDFRLVDRRAMNEFDRSKERGEYIRGLISWVDFHQVPFYYERGTCIAGEAGYLISKMLKFAPTAMLYFSKRPSRLATSLGFISVLVGIILAVWFTLSKTYGFSNAEVGWISIVTSIIPLRGVQLLTVSMLGQYIDILSDEIKARLEYATDEKKNH